MKKLLLLLLMAGSAWGTTYTEFFLDATNGNNLFSGHTADTAVTYTGVGDSDGTSVFTPSDGSTPASTVTNGAFGSVFVTSGTVITAYVGLITNVAAGANGAVTFSQIAKAGTFPAASAGAHTITLNVGGAWKGPNTNGAANSASGFPFNILAGQVQLTNNPNVMPRFNFKAGQYNTSNGITCSAIGPLTFAGFTNSPGDGGRATIDGKWPGAGMNMLTLSGGTVGFENFILQNTGTTSSSGEAMNLTGSRFVIRNCAFRNIHEYGVLAGGATVLVDCEATNCNSGNNAGEEAFHASSTMLAIRCIAHDCNTANGAGFGASGSQTVTCFNCISYNNSSGFVGGFNGNGYLVMKNCDAYSNAVYGVNMSGAGGNNLYIENCNFLKNGVGVGSSGSAFRGGTIINCGFGSGTQTNKNGSFDANATASGINVINSTLYAADVTPWVDPTNGNFTITAASPGAFAGHAVLSTLLTNSLTYESIGASYPTNSPGAGGGGTVGYGFAQ